MRRPPSLETLFVATFGLLGVRLGAQPIGDNSAFIHLRTGIDMVARGGIPRRDPYSATAVGEPWVVQSWLASGAYGLVHRLAGLGGVVVLQAVLIGLVAVVVARLARTGSALRTALAAGLATALGAVYWSPRPLVVGLLCFALLVTIVEERRHPLLLVPLLWVWVNSHGSFPLGVLWLALVAVGRALDDRRLPRALVRYALALAGGLAASILNPLGPRLLTFPVAVLERRDAFRAVVEWRSPDFGGPSGAVTLLALLGIVAVLARSRRPWSDVVPLVVLLASGLLAQRNLPVAAIAAAPVLGRALRVDAPAAVASVHRAFAVVLAGAAALFVVAAATRPALALDDYPVAAVDWLEDRDLVGRPHRVLTDDVTAGYLVLRFGRDANVFVDDRVDMYPTRVVRDLLALERGSASARTIVRRYGPDAVLWRADAPLPALLRADGWREAHRTGDWVVLLRP